MFLNDKNILIISNEPWGDVWYSKHNYAYELSKKNCVFFVNPTRKWRIKNLFKSKIKIEQVGTNLYQLSYFNIFPAFLLRLNNYIVSGRIRSTLKERGICDFIFWSFDPYRLYNPDLLGAKISLFHAVDKYLFIHPAEEKLYENVNLFLSVSKDFELDFRKYQKPILSIPHGVSSEEFEVDEEGLAMYRTDVKNYGLYVGNIDERLDYNLLEKVLIRFSSVDFVFIGRLLFKDDNKIATRIFKEKRYKNLRYEGVKPFKRLKYFIAQSSFCVAFMTDKFPGNLISHHKIYQYMALGKPVFSPVFSEYTSIAHLLYMENDGDALMRKLDIFLTEGESPTLNSERIHYARKNTYENIFDKISKYMSDI